MPKKLVEFVQNERRMALPPEKIENEGETRTTSSHRAGRSSRRRLMSPKTKRPCAKCWCICAARPGTIFSHYKRATVLRRIARRLQVNSLPNLPAYLDFLRTHVGEPAALLHDLLIGVTPFFRDRDAFAALEANVP